MEKPLTIFDQKLSVKLSKVLDYVGVSETMRKTWMEYGLCTESFLAIRTHLMNRPLDLFKFGSGIEGSTTPGMHSDLDLLLLHPIPVVSRLEEAPEKGLCYLMIADTDTAAGFTKLQVVKDGTPLTEADKDKVQPEEHYSVDKEGRLVRNNNTTLQDKLNHAQRTGPAQTCEDKNFGSLDYVEAYHYSSIPEVASKWFQVQMKKFNIINDDDVKAMAASGCFFVGIGHPGSKESGLEWRMSFSIQERMLMFSINAIQFKCYVMLKILKETFIKSKTGKSLSSYHCKTAVFHAIEQKPADFWTEENLVKAVFDCLKIILTWVIDSSCPNFFVRNENMFDRKIYGDTKKKLQRALEDIIQKGEHVLFGIECDKIGELLSNKIEYIKNGEMSDEAWTNLYRVHLDTVCEFAQSKDRMNGLFSSNLDPTVCTERLGKQIQYLEAMESLGLHDKSGIRNSLQYFLPDAKICLGTNLVACTLKEGAGRNPLDSVDKGLPYITENIDYTFLSAKLKYASCLFALGLIDPCYELLIELEKNIKPSSTTTCPCRHIEYTINKNLVNKLKITNPPTIDLIKTEICTCVAFQLSEMDIAPFALRYEMFRSVGTPENSIGGFGVYWYQAACVDAKVYLYFLKYLVLSNRDRAENGHTFECIDKIYRLCEDDLALNHRETAYNLLSWMYKQEGRVDEAVRYCIKSWNYLVKVEEKLTSSVHPHHNAVKWHVIAILSDKWKEM